MIKNIIITMYDNTQWKVPAYIIAKNRADYYSVQIDGEKEGSEEYKLEIQYALDDESELREWITNNMNWSDLVNHAVQIEIPPLQPDYESNFYQAEFSYEED